MNKQKYPLTLAEFNGIYSKVPRLTVELVIRSPQGIILAKLPKQYSKSDLLYLPGGTVWFKESLTSAVKRIARTELGIDVNAGGLLGYVEYPLLHASGYNGWPIGVAFEVLTEATNATLDDQGEPLTYAKEVPKNILEDQRSLLINYLHDNPY